MKWMDAVLDDASDITDVYTKTAIRALVSVVHHLEREIAEARQEIKDLKLKDFAEPRY